MHKLLSEKRFIFFFILIFCAGVFFRLYHLGKQSVWFDEASAFFRANKTPHELWGNQLYESSPPLYDFLLHYWLKFFHGREFQLRLLSAVLGVFLIVLAFIAGKYMFNKRVGLISSLLVAISPYHIYYSQEAKMYTLLSFLSLLSFLLFYLALTKFRAAHWISYALSSVLLIYCHNYGGILVFTQTIIFLIFYGKQKNNLFKFLLSQLFITILAFPRITCLSQQIGMDMDPWVASPEITDIVKTFVHFSLFSWRMPATIPVKIVLAVAVPVYLFFFFNAILGRDKKEHLSEGYFTIIEKKMFLLAYLFIPIALAFLISLKKSVYLAGRYDISFYPAFFLLTSLGLDKVRKNAVKNVFICVIIALSIVYLCNYYSVFKKSGDRAVARYLQLNTTGKDVFLFTDLSFGAFPYYWKGRLPEKIFIFPQVEKGGYIPRWAVENKGREACLAINELKKQVYPLLNKGVTLWVMYVNMDVSQRLIEELNKDLGKASIIELDSGINNCQVSRIYRYTR